MGIYNTEGIIVDGGITGGTSNFAFYKGDGSQLINVPDIYVTGFTYNNANLLTLSSNLGQISLNATINSFTGLTVNGNLTVTGTISGVTDTFITGGTFNSITRNLTLNRQNGSVIVTGFTDTFVTGGTYSNGIITLRRQTGTPVTITGLLSADTFVTGFTYTPNQLTIAQPSRPNLSVGINNFTGLTVNGSFSATTYLGLPADIFVTGMTFVSSILTLSRNQGLPGLTTIIDTSAMSASTDVFVTGFTYNNANLLTIGRNQSRPNLTVTINSMTGLTINGNLTVTGTTNLQQINATVFSGGTFYGSAAGLTNIAGSSIEVSFTSTTTTSSATPVLLNGMSATTTSGTYLALFDGVLNSSNGSAIITVQFYINGVGLMSSLRPLQFNNATEVAIMAKITTTPGSVVEVRWSTTGPGTATTTNRSLILL
jgi:hypothetical protein